MALLRLGDGAHLVLLLLLAAIFLFSEFDEKVLPAFCHQAIIKVAKWPATYRAGIWACPFFFWFEADGMGIPGVVCYTAPVLQQHEGLIIHDLQNAFSPPEFPFHHQICKNKSVRIFKFIINNLLKQQLPFDRLFGLEESAHWCHLHMYWFRGSEIRLTSTCFVSGESPIFQRGSSSYLAGGLLG